MAYVVAVSGISGAGKTSVIRRASELLESAVGLYFDDYAAASTYPPDLKEWVERGANVDRAAPAFVGTGEGAQIADDAGDAFGAMTSVPHAHHQGVELARVVRQIGQLAR